MTAGVKFLDQVVNYRRKHKLPAVSFTKKPFIVLQKWMDKGLQVHPACNFVSENGRLTERSKSTD